MVKITGFRIRGLVEKALSDIDTQELLKGTSTTLTLRVIGVSISYIFNIILARMYGAAVLGIFALSATLGSIFSIIGSAGTNVSIVRFVAGRTAPTNRAEVFDIYNKVLFLVLPLSSFIALILYLLSPSLAQNVFHKPSLSAAFRITAFTIPFLAFTNINTAALRGLKKILESSFFQTFFTPFFNTIGLLLLTYFAARNYLTPLYANLITAVIGGLFSLAVWFNKCGFIYGAASKESVDIREIIRVSLPMFVTLAMFLVMGWIDILMLGIFRTSAEVGVYKVALKVAMFASYALAAVLSIATPKFAELYQKKEFDKLRKVTKFSSKITFWSSFPTLVLFILLARQIMGVFGIEFVAGAVALIILSAGQFINAACGPVGALLNMTEHQIIYRNIVIAAAAMNLILNWLLIPCYGITGASVATAVSMIFWNIAASMSARKIFGYWVGYLPKFQRL